MRQRERRETATEEIGAGRAGEDEGRARNRLAEIFNIVLNPENQQRFDFSDGWLYRYYGRLREPAQIDRYVQGLARLLHPVWDRRHQLRFLDVGCGFGVAAVVLAVHGARSAQGLEPVPGCMRTCQEIQRSFPTLPVRFSAGRAETLPLPDRSVDVVLAIEAISHFVEPWQFLGEAWRVLAPGGTIIISDDNNAVNVRQRRELEEVWERFENGPPTDDIHGHRVLTPYVEKRREILREHFPQATGSELDRLSRGTSGLWGEALLRAGRHYFERGAVPDSVYRRGVCPVEPLSGAYMENPLDVRELGLRLKRLGADVDVRPYFGGESRGGVVRLFDTVVRRVVPLALSLRVAPGFRLYAWKR